MPFLLLLLSLFLLAGCDGPGTDAPVTTGEPDDPEPWSAGTYERRLLFVAPEPEPPLALVYDFSVKAERPELERTARAWLGSGGAWQAVLDEAWVAEWVREPWRLVPRGPLRLVIGEGDKLEAVVHRAEDRPMRLVPGPAIANWSPHPGGQLQIQRAQLRVDDDEFVGTLLDAHFVRELVAALTPASSSSAAARSGVDEQLSSGSTGEDGASVRTFDQAFVTDGRDTFLVVSSGEETTRFAWLQNAQETETWDVVELTWLEPRRPAGEAASAAPEVPTAWQLRTTPASLRGEFQSLGHEHVLLPGDSGDPVLRGLYVIRGWIEFGGERRQVAGIVVHGQE